MTQNKCTGAQSSPLPIIGLTGNSGSGKSLIASICEHYGAYVINADTLNHANMLAGGAAYDEICETFGRGILDNHNEIDRRKLGDIVFADNGKLQTLVAITHKHVIAETHTLIAAVQANPNGYKFIIIDAPLLIEADMHKDCDETWLVTANNEARMARIRKRDNLSDEQIAKRFASATPASKLAKHADVIIENNFDDTGTLELNIKTLLIQRSII
ncbi:MAG: dephospho-CoA kinase [Defluviitaleaceae bacterium]|nr:dephospho-CoA kinase [Defluviitaleaceae bacterium]